MSERPTPETDALILSKSGSASFSAWLHDYFQAMRFIQKHLGLGDIRLTLGQQDDLVIAAKRADEAREEWGKASMDAAQLLSEKTHIIAERDELQAKYDTLATEHMLAVNKLAGERDEAREEAKRLEGAYEDATNYYARIIELVDERDKFRNALREIASATGFDNIGNWARNTARKALEEKE